MGTILAFSRKEEKPIEVEEDFTKLLQVVKSSAQERKESLEDVVTINDPEKFIQADICSFILKNRMIDPEIFRCALYISKVIPLYFRENFSSYWVVDYFIRGVEGENPEDVLKGADFCFLLCSLFPERCNRKTMKLLDYQIMGKGLYFQFYGMTKKTIGLSMGNNFIKMTKVVGDVMTNKAQT